MDAIFLRSGYGNPDSRFEKEVSAVLEAGHNVKIIAWDRESSKDKIHSIKIFNNDVECIHIGVKSNLAAGFKKNLIPMVRFNIRLLKYLKKLSKEYEVIHASDFDTVVPGAIVRRTKHKKLVYDIYDYYTDSHHMPSIIKRIVKFVDTKIINSSDAVIVCNDKRKEQILPAKPRKMYVIHNSPSYIEEFCLPEKYLQKNRFRVVFIGGFARTGRYIFEMIDVIKNRSDCELIIGGFGHGQDEIQEISKKYKNITFIGKQAYCDVLRIESTADLLTALYDPSLKNHKYAAPNKFYEALMLGKPLVCAKNTNIDELVEVEKIGWVLDIPNESFETEFNKVLDTAIYGNYDKNQIAAHSKEIFLSKYNWDIMKERLKLLYSEMQL